MKCIKRFLAVFLVVFTLILSTVSAFAFDMAKIDKFVLNYEGDTPLFGTFVTSALDDDDKGFLRDFFNDFSGQTSTTDKLYVIADDTGIDFFRYPSDCDITISSSSSATRDYDFSIPSSYDYKKSKGVYFQYDTRMKAFARTGISKNGMRTAGVTALLWTNDSSINMSAAVASEVYPDYNAVGFIDDDGLLSAPEPEPPPVQPPKFPEIPKGDGEYVLYDTSVWRIFISTVRGYISSGTNVGILIFAIILGITISINIVKHFTKGR